MRTVSDDLKNAGRIDGLSEYTIFFRLVLPLVRPAMATVAVFTMIPIWNDLWFPLILAPAESTKTVTLGAQVFIGQFVTNWNAVLAALSPGDPAGAGPLPDLLPPAHPRHHRRSGEMTKSAIPIPYRVPYAFQTRFSERFPPLDRFRPMNRHPHPRRRPRQHGPQPRPRLPPRPRLRDRRPRQPLRPRPLPPELRLYDVTPDFHEALAPPEARPRLDRHLLRQPRRLRRAPRWRPAPTSSSRSRSPPPPPTPSASRQRPRETDRKVVVGYILRHHPSLAAPDRRGPRPRRALRLPPQPQPAELRPDLGGAQGADADHLAHRRLRRPLRRRDVPDHRRRPGRGPRHGPAPLARDRAETCTTTATSRCSSPTARSAGTRPAGAR